MGRYQPLPIKKRCAVNVNVHDLPRFNQFMHGSLEGIVVGNTTNTVVVLIHGKKHHVPPTRISGVRGYEQRQWNPNDEVEILENGCWWRATIIRRKTKNLFQIRWKIQYVFNDGVEQSLIENVHCNRIRSFLK